MAKRVYGSVMNTNPVSRYRARMVGSKFDYIRRFAVIDTFTGRRVRYSLCSDREEAQEQAAEMNAALLRA